MQDYQSFIYLLDQIFFSFTMCEHLGAIKSEIVHKCLCFEYFS